MNITDRGVEFSEEDFREVFALFSSASAYEFGQVDDPSSEHYFRRLDLFRNLEVLQLVNASVTDDGLVHLRGLSGLKELNLSSTAVSDAGLQHFGALS